MSIWTHDRVQRLTALWAKGHSASQIGAAIGVSRNAVIGKVHRINLPARAPRKPSRVSRPKRERQPRLPQRHRAPIAPNRFRPVTTFARQDQCAGWSKSQIAADMAAIWANTAALQNGRA